MIEAEACEATIAEALEGEVAGSADARRPIARQDTWELRANELQRWLIELTVSLPGSRPRAVG